MNKPTNKELLADALDVILDVQQPHLTAEEVRDIRAAARHLREMDGERIEGYVPNWPATNGIPVDEFIEFHLERQTAVQGDQKVAHATLIVHPQEPENRSP